MKAILLAAGLGTRLRPITDTVPKCMVPIGGRPLLGWWFDLLERHGVDEVLINLHHLPGPVLEYAALYGGPLTIRFSHEPELLGSAGTLDANRAFLDSEEQFYILYADNLTDVDLSALRRFSTEHPAALTVGMFHAENPRACGIATLDEDGTIVAFEEKPSEPRGDLASAGMFVARPSLFRYVSPVSFPYDFGSDVMPRMVGQMNGVLVDGYLRDVGTLEALGRAEREWSRRRSHPRL